MAKHSLLIVLGKIIEKMSSGVYSDVEYSLLCSILSELSVYYDKWQDRCDEQDSKEPDTDSAHERWQERQERLEERVDLLEEIVDDLESCISELDEITLENETEDDLEDNVKAVAEELADLLDKMNDYNFEFRGLKSIKLDCPY